MSNITSQGTPIEGAVALVTGGNRGFGRAIVQELLDRGAAKVYATSRSPHTRARRTDRPTRPRCRRRRLGGRGGRGRRRRLDRRQQRRRTPAHAGPRGAIDDIRADLETNLFGIIRVARAFAPVLGRHPRSAMVNVLSVLSWLAFGGGYEISKAAAWSATNAMRVKLRDQGTTVTALHVAYMDTDMTAGLDVPKADPRESRRQAADAIIAGDVRDPRRRHDPDGQIAALGRPHRPLRTARRIAVPKPASEDTSPHRSTTTDRSAGRIPLAPCRPSSCRCQYAGLTELHPPRQSKPSRSQTDDCPCRVPAR